MNAERRWEGSRGRRCTWNQRQWRRTGEMHVTQIHRRVQGRKAGSRSHSLKFWKYCEPRRGARQFWSARGTRGEIRKARFFRGDFRVFATAQSFPVAFRNGLSLERAFFLPSLFRSSRRRGGEKVSVKTAKERSRMVNAWNDITDIISNTVWGKRE